jgi:hypothetical protein
MTARMKDIAKAEASPSAPDAAREIRTSTLKADSHQLTSMSGARRKT